MEGSGLWQGPCGLPPGSMCARTGRACTARSWSPHPSQYLQPHAYLSHCLHQHSHVSLRRMQELCTSLTKPGLLRICMMRTQSRTWRYRLGCGSAGLDGSVTVRHLYARTLTASLRNRGTIGASGPMQSPERPPKMYRLLSNQPQQYVPPWGWVSSPVHSRCAHWPVSKSYSIHACCQSASWHAREQARARARTASACPQEMAAWLLMCERQCLP